MFTREILHAIPIWVEMGARPQEIAAAIGTSVGALYNKCSRHKISLATKRPVVGGTLAPRVWAALRRAADLREQTIPGLIADIVAGVVERGLLAEALEDRGDAGDRGG